jgi:hypothetical protein
MSRRIIVRIMLTLVALVSLHLCLSCAFCLPLNIHLFDVLSTVFAMVVVLAGQNPKNDKNLRDGTKSNALTKTV